ncbi:lactate/malate family dehydrogenase [Megasphaera vaginalis (ex Bordigoni et al. 2020)]|uniref:lactate/malate family dehydrogenase n=1 Tax=Megasphaera vaginalis (ex Bordigoni et al. 2020) TaxID=2045301 RepID=UPI001F48B2A9|nr:L-lactate dehydrogenase [Megasphaera vaginalis (ex Bordigoni et al. 2020)]
MMSTVKKRTVGVIGLGHVGAHVAFALGLTGTADEVKLCDLNESKAVSERQDLMDAVMFMPHRVNYTLAKYEEMGDCDVIINAIGKIDLCATGNRDDEMGFTVPGVAGYIDKVMAGGFDGVIINITNPCDVVTHLLATRSGLPKGRVFGTGTGLDTSRLVSAISQQTDVEHHSFTAYMMGEHGNSQMTPWSVVNFGGQPYTELAKENKQYDFDTKELTERAIKGGWVTYQGKHCTEYGIAMTAVTMASAVLHDEKKIMAASVALDGEYGEKGIFCGVPAVIGANGIERVVVFDLPTDELQALKGCCATIRANIAKADKLLQ